MKYCSDKGGQGRTSEAQSVTCTCMHCVCLQLEIFQFYQVSLVAVDVSVIYPIFQNLIRVLGISTSTTKVVLEAQWGICPALCVLRQYTSFIASTFLFVHAWAMLRILYLSCGVPFPVLKPDTISSLTSVVVWLSR